MPFPLRRVLDPASEPVSVADMKLYSRIDVSDDDGLISSLISVARERAEDLTARCLMPQQWIFSMDNFPTYHNVSAYLGMHGYHHGRHSIFKNIGLDIILPRGPVLSVDSIQYKDQSGTTQVLSPTVYNVDLLSEPARITPVYNGSWPYALYDANSITIRFTAGYQQSVTETVTMPSAGPFVATVSRDATAASLNSCVDATSLVAVAGTLSNGVLTCPGATANQVLTISYQVTSIPQSFIHAIKLMVSTYYENRAEVVQGGGNFNSFPMPLSAMSLLSTYELFKVGYPKG